MEDYHHLDNVSTKITSKSQPSIETSEENETNGRVSLNLPIRIITYSKGDMRSKQGKILGGRSAPTSPPKSIIFSWKKAKNPSTPSLIPPYISDRTEVPRVSANSFSSRDRLSYNLETTSSVIASPAPNTDQHYTIPPYTAPPYTFLPYSYPPQTFPPNENYVTLTPISEKDYRSNNTKLNNSLIDGSENFPTPSHLPNSIPVVDKPEAEYAYWKSLLEWNHGDEQQCEVGTSWTISCHECKCLPNATASCTRKFKCKPRPKEYPKMCKPYSTFTLDSCKQCECNGDGVPICEFKPCPGESHANKSISVLYSVPPEHTCPVLSIHSIDQLLLPRCAPSSTWSAHCQDCYCDHQGLPSCVKKLHCIPRPYGMPASCRPGSHPKDRICYNCYCNDEGEKTCT